MFLLAEIEPLLFNFRNEIVKIHFNRFIFVWRRMITERPACSLILFLKNVHSSGKPACLSSQVFARDGHSYGTRQALSGVLNLLKPKTNALKRTVITCWNSHNTSSLKNEQRNGIIQNEIVLDCVSLCLLIVFLWVMPALLVFLFVSCYWCYINIGVLFIVFPLFVFVFFIAWLCLKLCPLYLISSFIHLG